MTPKQRADLTFKDNLRRGRHGWVRLTPAYSVKVVREILVKHPNLEYVLDPFSGTGTTGLVAGQLGRRCDLLDINPFLIWLARAKCANYDSEQLNLARIGAAEIVTEAKSLAEDSLWFPPISNIERWWPHSRLVVLAKVFKALHAKFPSPCPAKDLLLVAFCRLIIQWSNAAFNHQSMSFKDDGGQLSLFANEEDEIYQTFVNDLDSIRAAASDPVSGGVQAFEKDARQITAKSKYDAVITSPPYVNRMSYIRELRPYMYWLGYLVEARDAGELDWEAIGGTWGIATSNLSDWQPKNGQGELPQLAPIVEEIARSSDILSKYVYKYFTDMSLHFESVYDALVPGGHVFYVVGNSKFYDTLVPAERLYTDLMKRSGFEDTKVDVIRKRNSKKELFEYLVSARKPL